MVKRAPARRRPRKAKPGTKGLVPAECRLDQPTGNAVAVADAIEKAGGCVVGSYKEPLGGHPLAAFRPADPCGGTNTLSAGSLRYSSQTARGRHQQDWPVSRSNHRRVCSQGRILDSERLVARDGVERFRTACFQWHPLFTQGDLAICATRLREYRYLSDKGS